MEGAKLRPATGQSYLGTSYLFTPEKINILPIQKESACDDSVNK
jgi:hypothetical protein